MNLRPTLLTLALPLVLVSALTRSGEDEDTRFAPGGFTLTRQVVVPLAPDAAFDAFTGDVSPWWDHHMSERPHALVIEPRVGGSFREEFDAEGGGVEHARVTWVQRGERIVLRGPLGFHGAALDLVHTFTFTAAGEGTRVALSLHGAGELTDADVDAMHDVWDHFLGNYRTHAEQLATGR